MSNENKDLHNEEIKKDIDSESISDAVAQNEAATDNDGGYVDPSDIGEEVDASPEEQTESETSSKKRKRDKKISVKAYLFSTVAVILATVLLTYSTCAEFFRAKYADNIVVQGQEEESAKTGIDLLNEYIDTYFYGEYDEDEMLAKALKAYVQATGDPYAAYYTLEELIALNNEGAARMCGIGVNVAYEDIEYDGATAATIHVFNVMEGSPALEAGVCAGDRIFSVKTETGVKTVTELGYEGTLNEFLGEEGTSVEFTVLRSNADGNYEEKAFKVDRKQIESSSVYTERLESDSSIGIVNILEFNYKTPVQFESKVKELREVGCEKFIIDLRANPGGYEISIAAVLSYFLNEGDLYIQTKSADGTITKKAIEPCAYSSEDLKGCSIIKEKIGSFRDLDVVVLCNNDTASAAELFVANFKDYGLAKIVGVTTYGKGCMQTTYPLNSGFSGAVKLTTHMYYSGGDKSLVGYDKVGIEPDYVVSMDEAQAKINVHIVPQSKDAQLKAAAELLK